MAAAPVPGRLGNVLTYAAQGVAFTTLIGTYVEPATQAPPTPPPSLGNLSVHYWHLQNEPDTQVPHKEDEIYYVVKGRGTITVGGVAQTIAAGDVIFVPRCVDHRFSDFAQTGLDLLVFFSPQFSG